MTRIQRGAWVPGLPTDLHGIAEIHRYWPAFLALGLALIVLGVVALLAQTLTTFVSVIFFGWLLLAAGVLQVVQAFYVQRWHGFLLHVAMGIIDLVVAWVILSKPSAGILAITLFMAVFFLVEGFIRMIAAIALRFPNWGWYFLSGVVTLLLGLMVWAEYPEVAFWVIGAFIGVYLIFSGWGIFMLGLILRRSEGFAAVRRA